EWESIRRSCPTPWASPTPALTSGAASTPQAVAASDPTARSAAITQHSDCSSTPTAKSRTAPSFVRRSCTSPPAHATDLDRRSHERVPFYSVLDPDSEFHWRDLALCAFLEESEQALFVSDREIDQLQAQQFCANCPVIEDCFW